MGFVLFVSRLEGELGVRFLEADLTRENVASVAAVVAFLDRLRTGPRPTNGGGA